jgi:glycosyltransferase involved in cell wall biosynthesis
MRFLHIVSSVDPKTGGPVNGIIQLSAELKRLNVIVDVCSLDNPDSEFLESFPLRVYPLGPSFLKYAFNRKIVPWLLNNIDNYDLVIINGIWQYHSYAVYKTLTRLGIPYFIFTHGMLDPWFKYSYPLKHLKKWFYWLWFEYRVLKNAKGVLFTSDQERLLARKSFWLYKANEIVTGYGINPPPPNSEELVFNFLSTYPELKTKRIVLFLSRIHEKKGPDILIEAFSEVMNRDKALHLLIIGPGEARYVDRLKLFAEKLGCCERVTWLDYVYGDIKWGAFFSSEVFCLPSHQENFGIAVAEALACGKPVLISNKINIFTEIEASGAGFIASDTLEGTVNSLNSWLDMNESEMQSMRENAISSYKKYFNVGSYAKKILSLI